MCVINNTDLKTTNDYDNITDLNFKNNCTKNENIIDKFLPTI